MKTTFLPVILSLLIPIAAPGATLYVAAGNPSPSTPFASWATAATNVQDAIDVSNDGDLILVTNGVYQSGGRAVFGSMTNRVAISKPVTVQSVNGPAATTIAGVPGTGAYFSSGVRCAYLTNGASLVGFTLTNGATRSSGDTVKEQSGGAAWCESSSTLISNCFLLHSYANQLGGGVYQGTLRDCVVSNDTAFISGGGVYGSALCNCIVTTNHLVQGSGGGGIASAWATNCMITWNFAPGPGGGAYTSTIQNCTVSNNVGGFGGGVASGLALSSIISSNATRLSGSGGGAYSNTLIGCTIQNNLSTGQGGGAYHSSLTRCLVVSNTATTGGGGAVAGSFDNCVIAGNLSASGGGVAADLASLATVLINSTIFANTATNNGGGIISAGMVGATHMNVTNCIIYGNIAPTGSNYSYAFSSELNLAYSCTAPPLSNGVFCISVDPGFVSPASGDFHLAPDSSCINSGYNPPATNAIDLDGNNRISAGTVDIGAYEFTSPSSVLGYAWAQRYGIPTDGSADFSDPDGDARNNWQEWKAGTDPTSAASVLRLISAAPVSGTMTAVSWESVPGIVYYLQGSPTLAQPPAFSTLASNILATNTISLFLHTNLPTQAAYFYRVGVQ